MSNCILHIVPLNAQHYFLGHFGFFHHIQHQLFQTFQFCLFQLNTVFSLLFSLTDSNSHRLTNDNITSPLFTQSGPVVYNQSNISAGGGYKKIRAECRGHAEVTYDVTVEQISSSEVIKASLFLSLRSAWAN